MIWTFLAMQLIKKWQESFSDWQDVRILRYCKRFHYLDKWISQSSQYSRALCFLLGRSYIIQMYFRKQICSFQGHSTQHIFFYFCVHSFIAVTKKSNDLITSLTIISWIKSIFDVSSVNVWMDAERQLQFFCHSSLWSFWNIELSTIFNISTPLKKFT